MKSMFCFSGWRLAVATVFMGATLVSAPVRATTAPGHELVCRAAQFSAHFDDKEGAFDGMSQRGTLLVLRNTGIQACQINALPALGFEGKGDKLLTVERRMPRGMHPGPVLLPLMVAPGAEVAMKLHWVSSDVYEGHNCVMPETAVLTLQDGVLRLPFGLTMCAAAGATEFFEQTPLGPVTSVAQPE